VILQCAYLAAGQVEASHAEYERTYDLAGNREDAEHVALYRARLGGDMDTIKAQFRRFLGAQVITTPYIAEYLEVIDQPEKVSAILRGAFEDSENDDLTRMPLLGLHAAMNGEPELALTAMRRGAVDLGFPASFIIWFPIFEDVRCLEGFKQLIRDLNLHHYWRQSGNWGDFARPLGDDDFEIIG
jgi:hypothetical protein